MERVGIQHSCSSKQNLGFHHNRPFYRSLLCPLSRSPMNPIIFRRTMSRFTIANLPRMEVAALSEQLVALKSPDDSIAIIDVRDGGTDCPLLLLHSLPPSQVYVSLALLTQQCIAFRPHRRPHQRLSLGPVAQVRRMAPYAPAATRGHQNRRFPLRPLQATRPQRRLEIYTRA